MAHPTPVHSAAPGLSSEEAALRLECDGPNLLRTAPKRPKWLVFLDQFRNALVAILLGAAILAVVVSGELKTPIIIAVVVFINAVLGFVQENRAERSLESLKKMLVRTGRVRRDGVVVEVPAEQLVVGDVVLIDAGDRVPADGRLLSAFNLEVEEAALTGESTAVVKDAASEPPLDAPIAERPNAVFMNTTVTRGRGEFEVTATGMQTEMGSIAEMLERAVTDKSPLQKQLDRLGHGLAALAGLVVAVVIALGLIQGVPFTELLLTAVALAVASIPEGLPAVLAVTLALGAAQMAKQQAIVKRLASVETLGCTRVICSDKTGTLTLNRMTATSLWHQGRVHEGGEPQLELDAGETYPALMIGVLCNDSVWHGEQLVGDPTEGALTAMAAAADLDVAELRSRHPRIAELPFDSSAKLMATVHQLDAEELGVLKGESPLGPDEAHLLVKGAPDVLFDRSSAILTETGIVPFDAAQHESIHAIHDGFASQGQRVLALGYRRMDSLPETLSLEDISELVIVALVGIVDPPRAEAREAIAACHQAGMEVKMITGDHAVTAAHIAAELGIRGAAMTGAELDRLSDEELARALPETGVFARVSPEHKLRLVDALRRDGSVVAMTGDGVNDAPALNSADIGIAMGITGTEVTKEAATLVLADDNFATIVGAVGRGRAIYDNVVKFVTFQLSTTLAFASLFTVCSAAAVALGKPFTALQILWVNIIMDGPPALALGVDPPASNTMHRPPRDTHERILNRARMARLGVIALTMAAVTLVAMSLAPDFGRSIHLDGTVAMTMGFTTFVLLQLVNLFNVRSETQSVFHRDTFTNSKLWLAAGLAFSLQIAAVELRWMQSMFDTTSLSGGQWLTCIGLALVVVVVEEVRKAILRRRVGHSPRLVDTRAGVAR